jgi:hypothetical protein
MEVLKVERLMY